MTEMEPSLTRIVKVWWLIFWRAALLVVVGGTLLGQVLGVMLAWTEVSDASTVRIAEIVAWLVAGLAGLLAVSSLFRKRFSDFRVALVQDQEMNASDT